MTGGPEPTIEALQKRIEQLERTLRTRVAELEAAERHIEKLEEKLLALKEAKKQLKQLKAEKQALRKSPERRVGQVLLAPYRLPQKLWRALRKHRPQAAPADNSVVEYQAWLERHRASAEELAAMREEARAFQNAPLISVIMPVFNTPAAWLNEAVESVLAQAYEKWELIVIDDASTEPATLAALASLSERDPRIRLLRLEENGGISVASNRGLAVATGEWIGLLDHDDLIEPDALYQTAKLLQSHPEADFIYSDEDKLTEDGCAAPIFKPDWSPDFFWTCNYLSHFTTIRRSLIDAVGGFRPEFDYAQDYDLYLRVIARTERIFHVPRVLYHWRRTASSTADNIRRKPRTLEAARHALDEALTARGERGHVTVDWSTHLFRVRRELAREERIAIIIPTRDQAELLERCLRSITGEDELSELRSGGGR